MKNDNWNIESELLKLSNQKSILSAVKKLNLIPPNKRFLCIKVLSDWTPGGAETYIFKFSVLTKEGETYNYIIKAIVTFIGVSLEDTLK